MTENAWREEIAQRVWMLQVLVGGLVVGCLVFMAVAVLLGQWGEPPAADNGSLIVTWLAVVFAFLAVGARMVVPAVIAASNRQAILQRTGALGQAARDPSVAEFLERTGDAGRLWLGFLTKTIIGAAILEGAAMFGLVAYLVEQSPLSLLMAIGFLAWLALHFPTQSGVIDWVQRELNLVAQQRQLQP